MSKFIAVLLSITMFITGTMNAQTVSPTPANTLDLKEAIDKETEKLKNESGKIDEKKMEKASRQAPQKSWKSKDKLLIIGIVAGLAALAVVLALTTKRCVKRSTPGCNFAEDINCQCLEYAQ